MINAPSPSNHPARANDPTPGSISEPPAQLSSACSHIRLGSGRALEAHISIMAPVISLMVRTLIASNRDPRHPVSAKLATAGIPGKIYPVCQGRSSPNSALPARPIGERPRLLRPTADGLLDRTFGEGRRASRLVNVLRLDLPANDVANAVYDVACEGKVIHVKTSGQ